MHLTSRRLTITAYYRQAYLYAEMVRQMIVRDVRVRYSKGMAGIGLIALQPMFYAAGLLVVFYRFNMSDGQAMTEVLWSMGFGMVIWYFFSQAIVHGHKSVLEQRDLLNKVYFPRLVIPMSKTLVTGIESLFLLVPIIVFGLLIHGTRAALVLIWLALFLGFTILCSSAASLLTARWLAVRNIVPVVLQVGIILSPVGYDTNAMISDLPTWLQCVYGINPMVFWIETGRWLVGGTTVLGTAWMVAGLSSLMTVILSIMLIPKLDHNLSDIV